MKNHIPLIPVESSSRIQAIGYEETTQTLAIQFKPHGWIYHYAHVEPFLFEEFKNAESKGSYFHKFIKGWSNVYPHTKCEEDET